MTPAPQKPRTTFKTNPVNLEELLGQCAAGTIQLPDFQRSWVWDEDRIRSLIASVSQAFPMGALMTLERRLDSADVFARRALEGAPPEAEKVVPGQLLLDGQQRMTSLYQTLLRQQVVKCVTIRLRKVNRWFYIDIRKALDPTVDRDDAIVAVPEDRKIITDFGRAVELDVSTSSLEYEELMFPANQVFDWDVWQDGFDEHHADNREAKALFRRFKNEVLLNFKSYQVPVIALGKETTHEAVCLVFEKVNTGGKALDAFELVTAMYAAEGHRLRDDWLGTKEAPGGMQHRLQIHGRFPEQKTGVLEKITSTDMLQAVLLLHAATTRASERAAGKADHELTPIRATRQSLLELPLTAYLQHRDAVEEGFRRTVKLLRHLHVFRAVDLPYQTQLVPLAAILAFIGAKWEQAATRAKLSRWYWCGVFGELYGSAVESRFVKDILEVPAWIEGGPEPATVTEGVFRRERLRAMRTRLSAAYKGVHALLMAEDAKDWRTGGAFTDTVYFDEEVDIHHIFPKAWCATARKDVRLYDSIINKTPLTYRTNRILGGAAPSKYLQKLVAEGTPPIGLTALDSLLKSHLLDVDLLRADDFEAFFADRERRLLALIASATGHGVESDLTVEEGEEPEEAPPDLEAAVAADDVAEAA
jgi:hypothetical protein